MWVWIVPQGISKASHITPSYSQSSETYQCACGQKVVYSLSVSLHDLVQFSERNTSASHLFQDSILRYSLNYSFECMCLTFLAHLAYTWVYSELRMLDIKTQEKSRASCGWRRSCSFFLFTPLFQVTFIYFLRKSFTTKVAHTFHWITFACLHLLNPSISRWMGNPTWLKNECHFQTAR